MHPSARRIALLLLLASCGRGDARAHSPARRDSAAARRDTAPAAADGEVVTETFGSDRDRGVFAIAKRANHYRVLVNGRALWEEDVESVRIHALMQPADGSALVVLAVTPGGTACDQMFRVVELRYFQPPRITPEFGTCDSAPEVGYVHARLRIFFEGWLPARLALLDTLPPDVEWPPDELLEYRDGAMVTIARGREADRLAGR
ncbi:hypothetical protein [Longimicrobium sp.]|uniref:hypothetical protein n=1 Tax=Longimicrobium sp. TaxID=2029185 RepID=UPI002BFB84C6|nr:hypothetical protein [Longimicrobium sp.]HSU14555.1 hypothetical protein [Longimicrobium sp.]